ncbi:DUF2516 family protein [Kineococcus gynurae]|uniref:DUF2516 family protein n=1 Tax=Kineococcus gynurae TaxID=452979 RepID=A0ABV5LPK8_9ACTN
MDIFVGAQSLVLFVLTIGIFAVEVWALVDAVRRPAAAYTAAGKKTKTFWVAILAVAAAIGLVFLPTSFYGAGFPNIFGIVAVVAAAVYLADVRPAVRQFSGRRRDDRDNRHQGPYGPW